MGKINWSSAVTLHPAYQMRARNPSRKLVKKARKELCQSLKKNKEYSKDKYLMQFLNLDEDSENANFAESILHTNMPFYFNKRNRTWSAFLIKMDFIRNNLSDEDIKKIENKKLAAKKNLLSFTMQSVDDYEREIKRFLCDEEYLETLNESIKYLMNKYLLKFIDKILKGNKDIERNIKGIENIEREINFIKKELLEELRQSDLVVDIEKAQKTIENFTRHIEDLVKECKPEKSEKIKELIKDKEKLIKDIENTPKIIENFTKHIEDLTKEYKPETPKKIKELIIGIKELIEDSKKKVDELLQKKLGCTDRHKVEVLDLFLYLFLRFSFHATWYESGVVYRKFRDFKDAFNRNDGSMPRCWYMAKTKSKGEKLVDIILYNKNKDKYSVETNNELPKYQKMVDENVTNILRQHEKLQNYIWDIRDRIYMPLFDLFNLDKKMFTKSGRILYKEFDDKDEEWLGDIVTNDTIVIPIFEIYINGIGYGRLKGVYALYREDQQELLLNNKHANEIKAKIAEYAFKISELLLQEITEKTFLSDIMIARGKISTQSKEKKTYKRFNHFFKYFLEIISYCQDWENIYLIKSSDKDNKDNKVYFWWGRGRQDKSDQESEHLISSEWKDLLEAYGQEKAKTAVKKVLGLDKQKYYKLAIEDCDIFSEEDFEVCNTLLGSDEFIEFSDCNIVLEYPENTIFPTDEYSCFMFDLQIKERLIQIVQMAYNIWKTNMNIDDYKKARGYIMQMSHNLNHALDGMSANLKRMIEPMQNDHEADEEEYSSPLLDPNSLNDHSTEKQKLLLGCHNFLQYLKNRFASFTLDVPGKENKDREDELSAKVRNTLSHRVMVDEFNKQILFKKYITWAAKKNDSKFYDVKLISSSPFENVDYEVCYDILYMFLENYIRNVVKHSTIILNGEPIRCYLEIQRDKHHRGKLYISIWEDSIKNILPKEFCEKHKELEDNIKERVDSRPFLIDPKATSAMVCMANSLCETASEIKVNPVFVVPGEEIPGEEKTSTRHEVEYDENKKGYYYKDKNKKEQRIVPCKSTNGDDGYRLSMEYKFKMDI